MASPFDWISEALRKLDEQSLLRGRRTVRPLPAGKCEVEGKTFWNFSANDYLGLASDPRVIEAAMNACSDGIGSRASALVTGRTTHHETLESKLASFKGAEAAIVFPTGFAANFGTITSLVGPEDVIFCDRLNHASLIDGARHSKAKFRVYPHCDVDFLRKELEKSTGYRRRLIITDSVFSMDGDIAPVAELARLGEEFHAMLLIDEAHATGVFGDKGTGVCELQSVSSENVIATGTLSKAIGSQGGFVTGSQELCDWLWNGARTNIFSTSLSIPLCAASEKSLQIIEEEPERRQWVLSASQRVAIVLREQGWNVPDNVAGPIIPVLIEDVDQTLQLANQLQHSGILVAAIRPPTVPPRTSRLRISLSYAHGEEGVEALIAAFNRLKS